MDARRKFNRFNAFPVDPRKPQVDSDTRATLSRVQAASSVTNRHRLSASKIVAIVNYNNPVTISEEQLIKDLNAACVGGYLAQVDNKYELTSDGISVVGEQLSDLGHMRKITRRRIKYQNRPSVR